MQAHVFNGAGLLFAVVLLALLTTSPASAQLEIRDLTAPNLIGDSNVESGAGEGPVVFTIGAQACNIGTNPLKDLFTFIGDGTTPGAFPVTVAPGPDFSGSFAIALLGGESPSRFDGKTQLVPGQCITFYYQVEYPVVDASGNATWGKSNTDADDLALDFTIWGRATDTVDSTVFNVALPDTVTVRNEITANPNKIQPNPSGFTTFTPDDGAGGPGTIAPGETITVTFHNATLGNPNQGFDADMDTFDDYDAWFQPIGESFQDGSGNRYWDPNVFRLIRVEAHFGGSGGGCNPAVDTVPPGGGDITTNPLVDDWYLDRFDIASSTGAGCSGWDGTYSYTFIALRDGVSRISPYQEVASGSDNEKYNGDYCGDDFVDEVAGTLDQTTQDPICALLTAAGSPNLGLTKDVSPMDAMGGDTLTYTLTYDNTGTASVGSDTSGIELLDPIPAETTYVAGSAVCSSANCVILYSTDSGSTWSTSEPPAASVTDLRWAINEAIAPAAMGTAGFQVVIDPGKTTGTVENTASLRIDTGPIVLTAPGSSVPVPVELMSFEIE